MTGKWNEKLFFVFVVAVSVLGFAAAGDRLTSEPKYLRKTQLFKSLHHAFSNYSTYLSFVEHIYGYLAESSENSTDRCGLETRLLLDYAADGDDKALKILDSVGMPSSGILEGGVFFIGFYSECVTTVVPVNNSSDLYGEYCLINLNFSSASGEKSLPRPSWQAFTHSTKLPTLAVCIPSSCSTGDLESATEKSSLDFFQGMQTNVLECHRNTSGLSKDRGAITALCVFLLVGVIAIVATIVDFMGDRQKPLLKEPNSSLGVSREVLCEMENDQHKARSRVVECLLAFSFRTNAKKIFTVESGNENTRALHGLKFFTMSLIILGHTFSFATQNLFFRNPGAAVEAPKDFLSQLFANGTLAVDTFYVVSGVLVAFVTLKLMDKTGGKLNVLYFYVHRYFRLTPLLLAVVIFCALLLRYMGSGPRWLSSIEMYDAWCKENGWTNALYLHNFIHTPHMCLSHTWYLATDMQFYIVTPLILIPLHRNLKWGVLSMLVFLLASTITTAVITAVNHYPAVPYINNVVPSDIMAEYYKDVYIKPYCRIGPYIVGIGVGYIMLHNKELNLRKPTIVCFWCLSVIVGLADIYMMWPANQGNLPTPGEAAAYSSLARTVWAVCIGWLILACYYSHAGFINSILSWTPLIPMSRLTYCAYLIHPVVMNAYYGTIETVIDFSFIQLLYMFLGNFCITYLISILLSLLFESPFVVLEKIMLSKKT